MSARKGLYGQNEYANGLRQKLMLLLIPVLAIVLWLLVRKPLQAGRATAADNVQYEATVPSETEDITIDWEIPPVYQPGARDPMQLARPSLSDSAPAQPRTGGRANLMLRGVLYSEDRPVAMIGTNLVREGQQIAGVTVVKITKDSVEFEMDGQRWTQMVSDLAVPSYPDRK